MYPFLAVREVKLHLHLLASHKPVDKVGGKFSRRVQKITGRPWGCDLRADTSEGSRKNWNVHPKQDGLYRSDDMAFLILVTRHSVS